MAQSRTKNSDKTVTERSGSSTEEVVERLRTMIQSGEITAGDRLPPERDLAKLLGVSRPTLRAGIRSLSTVGILQSRQGAGTFVAEVEASPTLDGSALRLLSALHGFTSDEMFEARLALEMSIAALAAERASSEQMTLMAEEIASMYASLDDPEQYLVHDMQFHQLIAAASENRILTSLMNMIAKILFDARRKTVKNATDLKDSVSQHQNVYRAIRERSPEMARAAMHDHLVRTREAQRLESESLNSSKKKKK
ncbi:MAG TPA: FadR/GntR family transcriptional regulator [Pyrinomonadaceae bacterium]|jgi:GntR family transcriptional repressor for pyruvate dehydrogenase complex|nr:FadR/GntR family transcriptional regulator [Pyrinomonadaceae bacterium]